jgi:hypothetical protein
MNPKGRYDSSKGQYKGVRGIGECGVRKTSENWKFELGLHTFPYSDEML